MESGSEAKFLAPSSTSQVLPSPPSQAGAGLSWLGLPRFKWSLTLLGLCVFTLSIVTYRFPLGEVGVAIAAVGLVLQAGKVRVPFPVWLYGAFVLWAAIASLTSAYPDIALNRVVEALKLFVIMLIIVNALQTEGQLRFYLLIFLACFVLYPGRGSLQNFAMGYHPFGRAIWNQIYATSTDLGTLSLLALGVALGFLIAKPSRMLLRLGAGISAVLLVVVILLTQSRAAFLGLVIGMGPALLRLEMKRPGRMLFAAGVMVLVVGFAVPASVWERLSGIGMLTSTLTIAQADPEGSAAQRFEIQQVGWRIFLDHPVFGVGIGAYPEANAAYAPHLGRKDTHNSYLNLAAEVGLPGLALWCALIWSVLRYAYRSRRLAAPGALATQQFWLERALWAYLVAGIFGTYVQLTFPYLMLAVLWCSAYLLAARSPGAEVAAAATKA